MHKIIKLGLILFSITAITGFILGGVYTATLEPIAVAKQASLTNTLKETLPAATDFTEVKLKNPDFKTIYEARDSGENIVGHNFVVATKGFGGVIELIVGISHDTITGVRVLSHSETPGLGAKAADTGKWSFIDNFTNKITTELHVVKGKAKSDSDVVAISGATITSRAVTNAVNKVLNYYKINYNGMK